MVEDRAIKRYDPPCLLDCKKRKIQLHIKKRGMHDESNGSYGTRTAGATTPWCGGLQESHGVYARPSRADLVSALRYGPMGGLSLAFKTYRANLGIWGSPWVGMQNYHYVFRDAAFWRSVWRTLYINLGRLIFEFPIPVLLSLMLNELRVGRYKKVLQIRLHVSALSVVDHRLQRADQFPVGGGARQQHPQKLRGRGVSFSGQYRDLPTDALHHGDLEGRGVERDHLSGRHQRHRRGPVRGGGNRRGFAPAARRAYHPAEHPAHRHRDVHPADRQSHVRGLRPDL